MPGVPEQPPRQPGRNGEEGLESDSWVEVEAAPAAVPEDLQRVADAAESGDADSLEEAMSRLTVDINTHAGDGDTALHLASLHGHKDCVEMLLARGASVIARDEDGAVPIHDAAASGFADSVRLLLDAAVRQGCKDEMLNAKDVDGDTPLHHAARGNHVVVIKELLAAGADAGIVNHGGKKPSQLADDSEAIEAFEKPLL